MNPEPADTGVPATDPTSGSGAGGAIQNRPMPSPGGSRRVGKTRGPVVVWLLTLITFGIYGLYWYYKVNDEVRDYDSSIEVEPVLSLLALFVPIVGWVSIYRCAGRIGRAQQRAGIGEQCSGVIGIILVFVFGFWVVYYQSQLNKIWETHGSPEAGTAV